MPHTPFLFLCLPAAVQAYTTFETACPTPNITTSFVSSPNTRGTLNILWSCLFTIFTCTWTIQHLNIPEQRDGRDPGWRGDLKWQLKGFWRSAKWMLATIVAPEILLTKLFTDLFVARDDLLSLKNFAVEDGLSWTLTHSMFANMGGFVIRSNVNGANPTLGDTGQKPRAEHDGQNAVAASLHVSPNGDIRLFETPLIPVAPSKIHPESPFPSSMVKYESLVYHDPLHLTAEEIIIFRRRGILKLPRITREEIDDKGKGDKFVRAIAVVQIVWIVVQIVLRASRDLAISQLEIAVLAFAACATIIYLLNWLKPKGVNVPYTLIQYPGRIPAEILQIVEKRRDAGHHIFRSFLRAPVRLPSLGSHIRNDEPREGLWEVYFVLGLTLSSTLFGGLHIIAWNFSFPTSIEKLIWRTASLWCTTFLFATMGILMIFPIHFHGLEYGWKTIVWTIKLFSILYILARIFLLVEGFRTLFFLPPEAYFSTWASNIPHLA